jgi:hypothetical protein
MKPLRGDWLGVGFRPDGLKELPGRQQRSEYDGERPEAAQSIE